MIHLKMGYEDVLNMPTNERRFHIGMLVKQKSEEQERMKEAYGKTGSGKGTRKTRISGEALKTRIKSGDVPLI